MVGVSSVFQSAATMPVSWLLNPPKESTRHESKLITRSSTITNYCACELAASTSCLGPTVSELRERLT